MLTLNALCKIYFGKHIKLRRFGPQCHKVNNTVTLLKTWIIVLKGGPS